MTPSSADTSNSEPTSRVRQVVDWELTLWLMVAVVLGVLGGALFALVSR